MSSKLDEVQRSRAEEAALNQAQAQTPSAAERRAYMEQVLDDDIDDASVKMISNIFSSSFVLGNLKDAEVYELKMLREITLKKIIAAHPDSKTSMQGDRRKQVYGDDATALKALSQTQKMKIHEGIKAAFSNLTRGRGGFQQEQFSKSISESHVEQRDNNDGGGLLSFS